MDRLKSLVARFAARAADSSLLVGVWAATAGLVRRMLGAAAEQAWLDLPVKATGLPFIRLGVVTNLHSYGLRMRLRYRREARKATAKRVPHALGRPLRVGLVGELLPWGGKPVTLVEQFPVGQKLFVFDVGKDRTFYQFASKPDVFVQRYDVVNSEATFFKVAEDINAANLDVLVLAMFDASDACKVLDRVNTPCIIYFMMSIYPIFSKKVDYSLFMLPNRHFYLRKYKLFSDYTGRYLPSERMYPLKMFSFADCSLPVEQNPLWMERENLIVFHGSVERKLEYAQYLKVITELLQEDPALRLAYLGPGDREAVQAHFAQHGLLDRVEDCGCVTPDTAEAREAILSLLRRGRLAPDPWPHGGGRARIEAYWAGIPTVHLRMPVGGRIEWEKHSLNQVDLPYIEVSTGTADDYDEYKRLCKCCLYNEAFANTLIEEQYAVARRAVDSAAWWEDVFDSYKHWLLGTGWCAGSGTKIKNDTQKGRHDAA